MRKLLALLLCVMLLPAVPAMAAESAGLPLFRLTVKDAAGQETTIGSAVLFLDPGELFTTAAVTDPDKVTAYGPDGSAYRVHDVFSGPYGYRMLSLNRVADSVQEAGLSFFGPVDGLLVGLSTNGRQYAEPAKNVTFVRYGDMDAYLVSADEPLMPGAVLLDEEFRMIGAVAATWGEGENRYVVLPIIEWLLASFDDSETTTEEEADSDVSWLTGLSLDYEEGVLTIDWSGSEIDGLDEDSRFIVYLEDQGNDGIYYSYYLVDPDDDGMRQQVYPAPGRGYNIWVSHVRDEDAEPMLWPDVEAVTFTAPDTGMLTAYGFTDECYIGWTPNGEDPNAAVSLMDHPRELIEMRAHEEPFYLRVANTYHVEEDVEQIMIIALQTPENYLFCSVNGFIFSPEYEENDVWNVQINELFDDYIEFGDGAYAHGEYRVRYAIGGVWAGECAFTME